MSTLKLNVEKCTIENTDSDAGFMYIHVKEEGGGAWLELHGNEDPSEYPLTLESEEEIDELSKKLKKILKNASSK